MPKTKTVKNRERESFSSEEDASDKERERGMGTFPKAEYRMSNSKTARLPARSLLSLLVAASLLCDSGLASRSHRQPDDLDNSILSASAASSLGKTENLKQADVAGAATANINSNRQADPPGGQLERRLDRLEFELRKTVHQMHQQQRGRDQANESDESANLIDQSAPSSRQADLEASKWINLTSRLELMEKFLTIAATKLYETEQRVKQLEKCDCRLSCKWTPSSYNNNNHNGTQTINQAAKTIDGNDQRAKVKSLLKMDGESWQNNCDVCSCYRGLVRCRHVSCPDLKDCPNVHYPPGKCCPVCYKSCIYKSQSIKHGNKLVINSNKDSCKECMCIDGRLKCQRLDLNPPWSHSKANLRRQQRSRNSDESLEEDRDEASDDGGRREEDYSPLDELDDGEQVDLESLAGWPRKSRRSADSNDHHLSLVCPLIEGCKLEDQFRLKNDCCTYCKGFDFCAHKSAHHCHAKAFCINTQAVAELNGSGVAGSGSSAAAAATNGSEPQLNELQSMFSCHCKPGFKGDGRHCHDIDECRDRQLNGCDPRTTTCVNLAGGYECACQKGFKPAYPLGGAGNVELASHESASQSTENNNNNVTSVWGQPWTSMLGQPQQQPAFTSCQDVNECADGKLNKCHSQAHCINKRGHYKCQCKNGYLGNGFECHKWFSSDPNVAAYLYRNQLSSNGTRSPLNSLDDDIDPDLDASDNTEKLTRLYKLADGADEDLIESEDDDDEEDEDADDELKSNSKIPKLSESKWEPLSLSWPNLFGQQQNDQISTTQAPVVASNKSDTTDGKANANKLASSQSANYNTRTMFFQPPPQPRFWLENVTSTTGAPDNRVNNLNNIQATIVLDANSSEDQKKSDMTANKHHQQQSLTSKLESNHQNRQTTSLNKADSQRVQSNSTGVYKKSTIIASAVTTPISGSNGRHTSRYYKSRALGVTSSAASSTIYSTINNHRVLGPDLFTGSTQLSTAIGRSILVAIFTIMISIINHDVTFYFN